MTTTWQHLRSGEAARSRLQSHSLPVLVSRLLTRRRVIDQMRNGQRHLSLITRTPACPGRTPNVWPRLIRR